MSQLQTLLTALNIVLSWTPGRIRRLRQSHALTQEDIGVSVGARPGASARTTGHNLETGKKAVTLKVAINLETLRQQARENLNEE